MKQDAKETQTLNNSFDSVSSSDFSKNLFAQVRVLCSKNSKGEVYCVTCDLPAVVCGNRKCECFKPHKKCEYFQKIDIFHKNLSRNLFDKNDINQVTEIIDKITDEVSEIEGRIEKQYTYFGLSSAEQEISKIIQNTSQIQQITGSQLKTFKIAREVQENWIEKQMKKFLDLIESSKVAISKLFKDLQQKIHEEHINFARAYKMDKMKSQILTKSKEFEILEKMLKENRSLIDLEKIYPADPIKNKLTMQGIFEACEKKENLLFLVENSLGRKFGAISKCLFEKKRQKVEI